MIDSHTHLFLCERPEADVVASAEAAGVTRMLNVGLAHDENIAAIDAANRHDSVFASVGCHPNEAGSFDRRLEDQVAEYGAHPNVVAIGETGIDYYRDLASPADQRRAFESQVEIASEIGLPVVIHARDPEGGTKATDEIFEVLDARTKETPVVLHCFSAPWRVGDAVDRGWHCSFAGTVTYPASDALREAAERVPDELLLVETDAPYLTPQPLRGKPNEPANVVETARLVAEVRGSSYEELERTVEENARTLFDW